MGKFTKNNFLNIFNKIKEFFRHRVGIIRSDYTHHTNECVKACGASSNGVSSKYGNILDLASYGAMKQEKAQSL